MSQTKCTSSGCTKWSFQAGLCKDHIKPPPGAPVLATSASGDGAVVKSGTREVSRRISTLSRAMSSPVVVSTDEGVRTAEESASPRQSDLVSPRLSTASRSAALLLSTKQTKAFSVLSEDKAIKSAIEEDIAARVKKLGNKKKKLTGGVAAPVTAKPKGLFAGLFAHDPKTSQSPSREEIKRQNNLRGTSAAAIAEMNQRGIIKVNTTEGASTIAVPPSPPSRAASPSPRTLSPSPRRRESSATRATNNVVVVAPGPVAAGPLFGVDLVTVCEGGDLPVPIHMLMARIQEEFLEVHGLFRVSGSADDIGLLITSMNGCWRTPGPFRDGLLTGLEVHTLSGALKQFWRKLPEPLFPYSMYPNLIACAEAKDAEGIVGLFNGLPRPRRQAAQSLFKFLAAVSRHAEVNMMSPMNLAICFAPNLIRPKQDTMDTIVHDTPKVIACVCVIIEFHMELAL